MDVGYWILDVYITIPYPLISCCFLKVSGIKFAVLCRTLPETGEMMLLSIITVLFMAYLGLAVILYFMQGLFLYRPVRGEVNWSPKDIGLDYERIALITEDAIKLDAWFVPAKNADFTLLFCHGNGGNMCHTLDSVNIFNELGLNVMLFDYRGYGNSQGVPSEEGTALDSTAAYQWLIKQKRISPDSIILFGRSLGGAIAAELARRVECAGLILESAFTSYADIGQKFYPYLPVKPFARFEYRTVDYLKEFKKPLLIIHSANDEVVPIEFGRKLYAAAAAPKEFLEIFGSHNDGFLYSGQTYRTGLMKWIEFVRQYQRAANIRLGRLI